jgi:hypothetical protein
MMVFFGGIEGPELYSHLGSECWRNFNFGRIKKHKILNYKQLQIKLRTRNKIKIKTKAKTYYSSLQILRSLDEPCANLSSIFLLA